MLIDVDTAARRPCDVLVVGAGAVGLALGIALARAGVRVTLVEAGGASLTGDYRSRNLGIVTGHPYRGLRDGRMRALGGTTRLWGGQLVAFSEEDFDATRPGIGAWPVRHAEIAPYIAQAFHFLGLPDRAVDEAAVWSRATGLSPMLGPDLRLGMNVWLPQPDFTRLFAREIAGDTLAIITDAPVERLVFGATGEVTAVALRGPDGGHTALAAPQVVLANGTLEIARLLLRTAATDPGCGFADNAHIGRHFIDHIHGLAGTIAVDDPARLGRMVDNIYFDGRKYGVKLRADAAFRACEGLPNCAGTINAGLSPGLVLRDLVGLVRRVLGRGGGDVPARRAILDALAVARAILPLAWRYVVKRRSSTMLSHGVALGVELEQVPTAASYLFLDPAFPPETAPIGVHWGFSGAELEAAARLAETIDATFRAEGIGRVTIDPRLRARDPAFLTDCADSYHQMGGARLAARADDGVVDTDLRVFGTQNLYVAGAAVFRSGSFANPTLTAIAFALRLAAHLAKHRGKGAAC